MEVKEREVCLLNAADREALVLFRAGYSVRLSRKKIGGRCSYVLVYERPQGQEGSGC